MKLKNKIAKIVCSGMVLVALSLPLSAYDPDRTLPRPDGSITHPFILMDDQSAQTWVVYTLEGPQVWNMASQTASDLSDNDYVLHCVNQCTDHEPEYQIENVNQVNQTMVATVLGN